MRDTTGRILRKAVPGAAIIFLFASCLMAGCGGSAPVPDAGKGTAPLFPTLREATAGMVRIAAGGDVNFGDGVTPYLTDYGAGYPFAEVKSYLETADAGFVNLECCISTRGSPVPGKAFCFRGPPCSAESLAGAGVDVVSLANNHSKDYGTNALLDTFEYLEKAGVEWCGAGNDSALAFSPAVVQVRDVSVAFLGFNSIVPEGWPATGSSPGCATTWDKETVAAAVSGANAEHDYVVASFHWGIELQTTPGAGQRELAHLAVDSGADLVLGHHPHVVQGLELYKNRLIAYSLGNYVFSPPREISAKTMTLVVTLCGEGLLQARVVPARITACRPVDMTGAPAGEWLSTIRAYSEGLGTELIVRDGAGYVTGERAPGKPPPQGPD